jgi:hypothetical protein
MRPGHTSDFQASQYAEGAKSPLISVFGRQSLGTTDTLCCCCCCS